MALVLAEAGGTGRKGVQLDLRSVVEQVTPETVRRVIDADLSRMVAGRRSSHWYFWPCDGLVKASLPSWVV